MKKRLLSVLLCLTLSMGMVLTGCGTKDDGTGSEKQSGDGEAAEDSGSEETKEISILWLGNDSRDGFQAVCDAAEEKLGIQVDIENPGWTFDNLSVTPKAEAITSEELQKHITAVKEKIGSGIYTDESLAPVQHALSAAETAATAPESTEEILRAAYEALQEAESNLVTAYLVSIERNEGGAVKRNNISYNMSLPIWRAIFLSCPKKPYSAGFAAMQ